MEFGKLTVIKELKKYKNNRTYYLCRCDCGAGKEVSTSQLTSGKSKSCGCLHFSNGEEYIKQVLDDNDIEYIRQKKFEDCKNIRPLPFDFYLPKHNTIIEFDGQQHFEPVEHWGGNKKFEYLKKTNSIKNNYCNDNNIKLIRFPYNIDKEIIKETIINIQESRNDQSLASNC